MDCSEADSACQIGVCVAETGECVAAPVDGGTCDDGDPCTHDDACSAGACGGAPIVCEGTPSQACHVIACDASSGACVEVPGGDGASCDDGSKCTTGDVCSEGACAGTPLACGFLDGPCKSGTCDAATGSCVQIVIPAGTPCDDGAPCTIDDVCSAGACVGQALDCAAQAGPCQAGQCDPETGTCAITNLGAGTPCNDADPCTKADVCISGSCTGLPTLCDELDGPCVQGACNPATGGCKATPIPDDSSCDDGLFCTVGDHCVAGACLGDGPDCSELDDGCLRGVCNDEGVGCKQVPAPTGTSCDDGDLCTGDDGCTADGSCEGAPAQCEDGATPCLVGACDPATGECAVVELDDGAACDDDNGCTEGDTCLSSVCVSTPKDCGHLDGECSTGFCSPTSGSCLAAPKSDGGFCNDGNLCTLFDSCSGGSCVGQALDCHGLDDACNDGKCNPATAACYKAPVSEGKPCNDLDPCTKLDSCSSGVCTGNPKDCSDLEGPCIQAACNPSSGLCASSLRPDGAPCDDGNPCTTLGECSAGYCQSDNIDCTAFQDPCNTAMCDASTGQCYAQPKSDGTGCNDDDPCTQFDGCHDGVCSGFLKDCSAFDGPCTQGYCDSFSGFCAQQLQETGSPCSDGDPCTGPDVCQGFTCFAPDNPDLPGCVQPCNNPIPITDLPFTYADTTASSSDDFTAEACGLPDAGQGSPDVLFSFTPPANATYRFRLSKLDFDPNGLDALLYLTDGCPSGAEPLCQGIADVQGQPGGDAIVKSLGAGTPLLLVVDGAGGSPDDVGSFVLVVEVVPPVETDCDDELDDDADGAADCADDDCSGAFACIVEVPDGALAITEIMGRPGGSLGDPSGEFIEVSNPTASTSPLGGVWITVRSWGEGEPEPAMPDGAWQNLEDVPLEPGDVRAFAASADPAESGGIAALGAWEDAFSIPHDRSVRFQLVQPTWDGTGNPSSGQLIDSVVVPAGSFATAGRSWMLNETQMGDPAAAALNDNVANWCLAPVVNELIYAGGNYGTPGIGNPACTQP